MCYVEITFVNCDKIDLCFCQYLDKLPEDVDELSNYTIDFGDNEQIICVDSPSFFALSIMYYGQISSLHLIEYLLSIPECSEHIDDDILFNID